MFIAGLFSTAKWMWIVPKSSDCCVTLASGMLIYDK
jgi:hypothetical protein